MRRARAFLVLAGALVLTGCQIEINVTPQGQRSDPQPTRETTSTAAARSSTTSSSSSPLLPLTNKTASVPTEASNESAANLKRAIWLPTAAPVKQQIASSSAARRSPAGAIQLTSAEPVPAPAAANVSSQEPVRLAASETTTTVLRGMAATSPTAAVDVPPETESIENGAERYPINLVAVMQLAGAENWEVHLAAERVREAQANLDAAQAAWLPSLVFGVGYTKHDGQIQATTGEVIDVSRNSLFVGGGAKVGPFPLAGGAGGPARLAIDLSLADALYRPLVARQIVEAEEFRESATFDQTLLDASIAYNELVFASGHLQNVKQHDLPAAERLLKMTQLFVEAGRGSNADIARVQTEVARRQQSLVAAEAQVPVASAELARLLQLDPQTSLFALEETPAPVSMFAADMRLDQLVAQAVEQRPEIGEQYHLVEAAETAQATEQWRPFLPHFSVGTSAGGFGGGRADSLKGLDGRSDFDLLAVWRLENLGLGTQARQERASSRHQQSLYRYHRMRDQVVTEVTQAYHDVQAKTQQIELAATQTREAQAAYDLSTTRIKALAGLPLEALQAAQSVMEARRNLLRAVIDHNVAQLRLKRAVGGAGTE